MKKLRYTPIEVSATTDDKLLKKLYRLETRQFVEYNHRLPSGGAGYQITTMGIDYLLERHDFNWKLFWDWFKYIVTTLIAVAALIISIIAIKQ